jgi:hypothetical protein
MDGWTALSYRPYRSRRKKRSSFEGENILTRSRIDELDLLFEVVLLGTNRMGLVRATRSTKIILALRRARQKTSTRLPNFKENGGGA